jgi:hypothetical protein
VGKRILFAYIGTFGLPMCVFPFVIVYLMIMDPLGTEHPYMIPEMVWAPIGMLAGLIYTDIRRHIIYYCIVFRSLAALVVFCVFVYGLEWLAEHHVFINKGWVLSVAGPLLAAVVSEFVLRRRRMPQEVGFV